MPPMPLQDAELRLLRAVAFAAARHRHQRRKDSLASPYVNHPIEVALHLVEIGGVREGRVLQAALLHDVLEDTETRAEEITQAFGREVCGLVEALSDDPKQPQDLRKRLEIDHAPELPQAARLVKIADKTCNVREMSATEPAGWSRTRKLEYIAFARKVVAGCRGASPVLERHFEEIANERELEIGKSPEDAPGSGFLEMAIARLEVCDATSLGSCFRGGVEWIAKGPCAATLHSFVVGGSSTVSKITAVLVLLLPLAAMAQMSEKEYRSKFTLQGRTAREYPDLQRCLEGWPDNPFEKQKDLQFRVLSSSVTVFGIGASLRDDVETAYPQLVFVRPAVNVLGGQTLELLNPEGWYCLESSVAVLSKSTIRLACKARIASAEGGVTVLGANDSDQGVTVLGKTAIERVGCD